MKKVPKIPLEVIIEALEEASDDGSIYYDTKTGEKEYINSYFMTGEEEEEFFDRLDEEEDRYILLPGRYEVSDYAIMTEFAESQTNPNIRMILQKALDGKGAFKRFRDELYYNKLWEAWNMYQRSAYRKAAIRWCQINGIEYTEKGRSPLTLERLSPVFVILKCEDMPVYQGETWWFLSKTDSEISLVREKTEEDRSPGYTAFRVQGILDFSLTGILSGITRELSLAKIPVFALSTYDTDYILVREEYAEKAAEALREAEYRVI